MRRGIYTAMGIMWTVLCMAQSVTVSTSVDTLLLGNAVEVRYVATNLNCHMEIDFGAVPVVGGPSTTSSIQIVNGQRSSTETISVLILPSSTGVLRLPIGRCLTQDSSWQTPLIELPVHDNPDGVSQDGRLDVVPELRGETGPRQRQGHRKLKKI